MPPPSPNKKKIPFKEYFTPIRLGLTEYIRIRAAVIETSYAPASHQREKLFEYSHPGAYIRWLLRNRCASEQTSLLFNLIKAFD